MIVQNITKTYEGRKVLDVQQFEFEKGKIYAVVGANGSGKSTFAKVLSGAVKADGGTVEAMALSDTHLRKTMRSECPLLKMS